MDKGSNNTLGVSLIKRTDVLPELPPPGDTTRDRIQWALLRKNYTIAYVASKTGLSPATITNPKSIASLRLLANILGLTVEFLGCLENSPEETLGQRITKARLLHGLTKEGLAKQLRVDVRTLRGWEQDKQKPTEENMSMLKEHLSILND